MNGEKNYQSEWQKLSEQWPPYMSTSMVAKASGGIVATQTLYNLTTQGKGIKGGRRIGKRICFPRVEVVKWFMVFCGEIPSEEA